MLIYSLSFSSRPEVKLFVAGENEADAKKHYFSSTKGFMSPHVTEVILEQLSEEEGLNVVEKTKTVFVECMKMIEGINQVPDGKLTPLEKSSVVRSSSSVKWAMELLRLSTKKEDYI